MAKIASHNKNLEEIGIDEEAWYRLWYDLYHNSLNACNPQSANVLTHYANIPPEYITKFRNENAE